MLTLLRAEISIIFLYNNDNNDNNNNNDNNDDDDNGYLQQYKLR